MIYKIKRQDSTKLFFKYTNELCKGVFETSKKIYIDYNIKTFKIKESFQNGRTQYTKRDDNVLITINIYDDFDWQILITNNANQIELNEVIKGMFSSNIELYESISNIINAAFDYKNLNTIKDLIEHNEKAQKYQDSLSIEDQIEYLKKYKKSVFTFHMEDGRKIVSGDSESNREEMEIFFKNYPQNECKYIEFHK